MFRVRSGRSSCALRLFLLPLLALATGGSAASTGSAAAAVKPADRAGVLFAPVSFGFHSCSGVVVHSARRDLVATAAHCVVGPGVGFGFAPGYADGHATGPSTGTDAGHAPYGTWRVKTVWVDSRWIRQHGNPAFDLAILAVQPQRRDGQIKQLEDIVPGAELAHAAPTAGTAVHPIGYPIGKSGKSVSCNATSTLTGSSPTFACPGFIAGTSGGPWLTTSAAGQLGVAGLTSGLHQGGCTPDVSYATPLGAWSDALLARAERRAHGDLVPLPPNDGC